MRNSSIFASLEEERGNARIPHVEEDRRDESRGKKFRAVLCNDFSCCVYAEDVYVKQLCRFCDCVVEEHIVRHALEYRNNKLCNDFADCVYVLCIYVKQLCRFFDCVMEVDIDEMRLSHSQLLQ